MTKVKIPECSNPFEVTINGRKYIYEAGIETDVPDDVAKAIEKHKKAHYKDPPEAKAPFGAILAPLTLTGAVEAEYDGSQPLSVEIPGGAGDWELLAEGFFGMTSGNKAMIYLQTFGKKQYYISVIFNKTTAEAMPIIVPPSGGVTLTSAYKSSAYAQNGFVYIEYNNDDFIGYGGIIHGWGSSPQGKTIAFTKSPRWNNDYVAIGAETYIGSDETLGTYKVYGR